MWFLLKCDGLLDEGLFLKLLEKKSILSLAIIYIPNLVKLKSRSEYVYLCLYAPMCMHLGASY
jgi:hypothetical protein